MTRRICVVTGSRAEYGLLYWVLHDLQSDSDFELQLVVTGMHLAHEFGHTIDEIEKGSIPIARRVDMLVSGDTPSGTAKSIGLGVIGMSDVLEQLRPEIVLVLGDRFEVFATAQSCLVHNVPIAHIGGGDTTEGAIDESMRHAITKMSHVHFVTNELSAMRVRQLGEDPASIHVVGSPGLDHLRRLPLLDRAGLEQALGATLGAINILITFHPVTLEPGEGLRQFAELLAALEGVTSDTFLWFTLANADSGGRELNRQLHQWVRGRSNVRVYESLGQLRYLSLMSLADAVVGNSSSGLYEAPSFRIPTVNIGNRQRGRLSAVSVLHCEPSRDAIAATLHAALMLDCHEVKNPYGDGDSSRRIVQELRMLRLGPHLLQKHFHLMKVA